MGNFSNNAITDVGKMLLADVQAGAVFTPTRIVIGSGSMIGGATAQGMTDVITPVKSLAINKKQRTPDGKCIFGGVYTNEEVTEPFYFRELALYAKAVYLNEDGSVKSEGAETLYSYGNAGATADYMPAYSTSTVVEKQIDLVSWVGNDAQVDLTIDSGLYITHENFNNHAARHAAGGEDPITPEDIGALNKNGGTMTDNLKIAKQTAPTLLFAEQSTETGAQIQLWKNQIFIANYATDQDSKNYRSFYLANHKAQDNVANALRLTDVRDGVANYYTVLHTGNLSAFGLGTVGTLFDVKNIDNMKGNGWFYAYAANGYYIETVPVYYLYLRVDSWKYTESESLVVQTLHYETHRIRRICKNDVWGLWEWENPPMVTGVEYRTTERYNNAAVFKKVDADGNILWKTWNDKAWHLLSSADYVATATVE